MPAGRFEHCVLAIGSYKMRLNLDPVIGAVAVPIVSREWYCPGRGMVKLVRSETVAPSR